MIIQEYDDAVFKKGKVNKTQFALKHGLAVKLANYFSNKSPQCMNTAETDGKAIEGRGNIHTGTPL